MGDPEYQYYSDDYKRMAVSEIGLYSYGGDNEDGTRQYYISGVTNSEADAEKFINGDSSETIQKVVRISTYDALYDAMRSIGIRDPHTFAQNVELIKKWKYDWMRAREFPSHSERCSDAQSRFIATLMVRHPEQAEELETIINCFESSEGSWIALDDCSAGAAMFVIAKLKALG